MQKANQDIRDYMADRMVTQRDLAKEVGVAVSKINKQLQIELSQKDKEMYLNMIDSIAAERVMDRSEASAEEAPAEEATPPADEAGSEDVSQSTKFQIGDRVKIPSKDNKIGTVSDVWCSLAKATIMYAVDDDSGHCGLYGENQLEIAPLPINYTFNSVIDGNVAVVTMNAQQGEKTWVYARGHAHILHDGEVGMAQAISYAARRMFESLDKKQPNKIYVK